VASAAIGIKGACLSGSVAPFRASHCETGRDKGNSCPLKIAFVAVDRESESEEMVLTMKGVDSSATTHQPTNQPNRTACPAAQHNEQRACLLLPLLSKFHSHRCRRTKQGVNS